MSAWLLRVKCPVCGVAPHKMCKVMGYNDPPHYEQRAEAYDNEANRCMCDRCLNADLKLVEKWDKRRASIETYKKIAGNMMRGRIKANRRVAVLEDALRDMLRLNGCKEDDPMGICDACKKGYAALASGAANRPQIVQEENQVTDSNDVSGAEGGT